MKILISCPLWLSSVLNKELKMLGYKAFDTFDTWTYVEGDLKTLYQINLRSRVANKTYIILGEHKITDFDELFDRTMEKNRRNYIPNFSHISVFAKSKNSKLQSEKTIQSITQKAIYQKLLPNKEREDQKEVPQTDIRVNIFDDKAQIMINATGQGLFKRGYRTEVGEAPIKENLAAWLILLTGWRFKEKLIDPFCGSGTFLIEAALLAKNIAPWAKRSFAFQNFKDYKKSLRDDLKKEAKSQIYPGKYQIYGYDISSDNIAIARDNAANAGVQDSVVFTEKDFFSQDFSQEQVRIITNPPYGKRIELEDIQNIYQKLINILEQGNIKGWFITNRTEIINQLNHKEWKKNYLYNGGEPSTFRRIQHNHIEQDPIRKVKKIKNNSREQELLKEIP